MRSAAFFVTDLPVNDPPVLCYVCGRDVLGGSGVGPSSSANRRWSNASAFGVDGTMMAVDEEEDEEGDVPWLFSLLHPLEEVKPLGLLPPPPIAVSVGDKGRRDDRDAGQWTL